MGHAHVHCSFQKVDFEVQEFSKFKKSIYKGKNWDKSHDLFNLSKMLPSQIQV